MWRRGGGGGCGGTETRRDHKKGMVTGRTRQCNYSVQTAGFSVWRYHRQTTTTTTKKKHDKDGVVRIKECRTGEKHGFFFFLLSF